MVEPGEIVYCNLTIEYKKKNYILKEVVYKNTGELFYNKLILNKIKINEPVEVKNVEIIARLGFENKSKEFTEVKGITKEVRNIITGAYE